MTDDQMNNLPLLLFFRSGWLPVWPPVLQHDGILTTQSMEAQVGELALSIPDERLCRPRMRKVGKRQVLDKTLEIH